MPHRSPLVPAPANATVERTFRVQRPANPRIILHYRVTASKALLVTKPLESLLRHVALLHRRAPHQGSHRSSAVARPDSVRYRDRSGVTGWRRKPAHLRNCLTVRAEFPSRFSTTVPIDKYKTLNGGINLHDKHPRPPRKETAQPLAGFYRPHQHIADAQLACFVTAVHSSANIPRSRRYPLIKVPLLFRTWHCCNRIQRGTSLVQCPPRIGASTTSVPRRLS